MKKIITFIIGIITIITFFIVFNIEKANKVDEIQFFETNLQYNYQILIPSKVSNSNQEMVYKTITEALKETNGNIYYDRLGDEGRVKYVYLTDSSVLSKLKLEDGRVMDINEIESDKYLSTINTSKENQIGTIEEFSGGLNFQVRTLRSMIEEGYFLDGYCNLSFQDGKGVQKFLEKINKNTEIGEITIEEKSNLMVSDYSNISKIIIILDIIIMLIVLYSIIKSYKKIGIEKLLGSTTKYIWIRGIKSVVSIYTILITIVTITMSLIMFKEYGVYFKEFIRKILLIYSLELVFLLIVCSIPYIYVSKIKVSNILKNKKPTKEMLIINFSVKILLVVILFVNINNGINNYKDANNRYVNNFENWDRLDEYYSVPGLYRIPEYLNPSNKEYLKEQKLIYEEFNKDGGIYANFKRYSGYLKSVDVEKTSEEFKAGDEYKTNSIFVNNNYLYEYPAYDLNGEIIEIDEYENNGIVLIPEKYKSHEKEILDLITIEYGGEEQLKEDNRSIEFIWMKNNQKFFSMLLDVNPDDGNMATDPIINVLTLNNRDDFAYNVALGMSTNPFKIKVPSGENAKGYIKEVAGKYGYDKYIKEIIKINDSISAKSENLKTLIEFLVLIILVFGSVIIMAIIQSIYLYFEQYKQTIAIRGLHGYRWIDKYQEYFIMSGFSWLLIVIALLVSRVVSFNVLTTASAICLLIELVIVFITLGYISSKKISKVIKGDD